jgi:formate dehydrogenase iron-sulfur subunit
MKAAILTDLTRCIGCEACAWACKDINQLPREDGAKMLSSTTWTAIERRGSVSVRRQCMHCEEPSCASVCPVAAFQKTPEGPVIYKPERCMGCRYCMLACPFGVPKYEWDKPLPLVRKCIMCFDQRVKKGLPPACTSACPTGATVFGDRDQLIREARRRMDAEPSRYVDHVYGLTEAGGTSVMYLSGVPFEQLGFKVAVQGDPYPKLTWNILSKLPNVVSIWGVTLFGIWWIVNRRETLEHERRSGREDTAGHGTGPRESQH